LLTLAISVQTVFMPILKRNADKSKIQLLLFLAIILGMLLYIYFGIVGGYGLKDRVPAY
jgi:nitrate reductase NapE component